jgi:hypothetical protein
MRREYSTGYSRTKSKVSQPSIELELNSPRLPKSKGGAAYRKGQECGGGERYFASQNTGDFICLTSPHPNQRPLHG